MRIREFRNEAEFQELKPLWDALLRASPSNTIFLTWEWIAAWWSAYGEQGQLRVLAAFDDEGKLQGVAPLRRSEVRRYGQSVPVLSFVGDGSNDTDYLDFVIAAGSERLVLEEFRKHLDGELLWLNEIPESSPNLPLLEEFGKAPHMLFAESDVPCATVPLPNDWENYLGRLRPRFRTKIRSVLRELEGRSDVRFAFCDGVDQVRGMLPTLFDLHTRRWEADGKPGVFGWDKKREFYAAMAIPMLERGWLRFGWVEWKGTILACQFGFLYDGKYFLLQEGYEPASEHLNLGVALRAWSIREFIQAGVREYDFLAGSIQRHRSDWGAVPKLSKQIRLCASTYKNVLACRGPVWEEAIRESMKRLIPEKLLELRKRRMEVPATASQSTSEMSWLGKATARCYFNVQGPAIMRPLREQYQLSLSRQGILPKLSLARRSEPSARILYFHRVNDERDPFFPAMSTALFEQEMRFVARHYNVVSLSKMLDHLEQGSKEPVMAITFDDGYQDNFQNAFPILQRYNLPATIFLTTGSLDSRDPMWFEELALAAKRTTRPHIDLEIDVPRRLTFRTQAERLVSQDKIYSLLRPMPDHERRRWLQEILGQLGYAGPAEVRDRMLTWDQARLMKNHGIDFGGHTVTHPFISTLPREQVNWEVRECKRRIEEEMQSPVDCFAYPSGRDEDFGKWNKELVSEAGYRAAVTTIWGVNYPSTDRMELRRGGPWEENPAEFAYKLDWYQMVNG